MTVTPVSGLRSAVTGLLFAGLLGAQSPDVFITRQVRRPAFVNNRPLHFTMKAVSFVGGTAPFIAPFVIQGPEGRAEGRAVVAGWLTTSTLKFVFGRARPYAVADTNAGDFGWMRGRRSSEYRSMPSGHATVAFAFAQPPARSGANRAGMYSAASIVSLSRIYLDRHWTSDVLFGAAIGE